MKKLFIIFLFVIFFSTLCSEAKSTKFAVVSDVHIALSKSQTKGETSEMTESIHYLQEAVKQINGSDVDFVVFLGDAIDKTNKISIVMFAKIINDLKKPYYVLTGDHDVSQVSGIDKKEFYHLVNMFSKNKIRKLPYLKRDMNNLVFIFMDGTNELIPSRRGFFREDALLWLDSKLKKYRNKKVVILQHYPLVPPSDNFAYETYNKDEYVNLLGEHSNVISIISGHYHQDCETDEYNIKNISVPSLRDSGEYSNVEIEQELGGKYFIKTKILDVK